MIEYYNEHEPKGEYVLILEGKDREQIKEEAAQKWQNTDINEHMAIYEGQGYDRKEAMKMVAADRKMTKREVYRQLLEEAE